MKKVFALFCIIAILFSAGACKKGAGETQPSDSGSGETAGAPVLRVIDGEGTERFVLAGENAGDLYTAASGELTVYLDGEKASPADLKNGMALTLGPDYFLLETWPAQLTGATVYAQSKSSGIEDHGDLCGLYLQVLEDLWEDDSGLNENITYISVDLDKAPGGLTDGEKAAVTWIFAGRHNAQGLRMSFEELKENGYVDANDLYWEDGVLLSISADENYKESAGRITFTAEKWRSGTGAIFFNGCNATKRSKDLKWGPYEPGGFAIA